MSETNTTDRKIVITGLGIFSPIGIGPDTFWEQLSLGHSGIARMEFVDKSAAPGNVGGEVTEFTESSAKKQYLKGQRKSIKVMCREIQMGVAAALQSIDHSGLDLDSLNRERFGIDFGANLMLSPPDVLFEPALVCTSEDDPQHKFEFHKWGTEGANAGHTSGMARMEPLWLLKYLPNMPACHIGIFVDARGPNNSLTLDESSGNAALTEAVRVLQRGAADVMIAGVTGTRVHPVKVMHAALWDQLADYGDEPPETWCRPFDATRRGQVVAEGACSLFLENEEAAKARGATIYGRVLGMGSSCVISPQGRANRRQALVNAMQAAFHEAGMQPGDIGHVNAHATGEVVADREEAAAIREFFGDKADAIPVTSLMGALGNSGSASGLLKLAGSLLGLRQNLIPPTLNYNTPDPECPVHVVHGQPQATTNRTAVNLSVTRTGQATAVIVEVD